MKSRLYSREPDEGGEASDSELLAEALVLRGVDLGELDVEDIGSSLVLGDQLLAVAAPRGLASSARLRI